MLSIRSTDGKTEIVEVPKELQRDRTRMSGGYTRYREISIQRESITSYPILCPDLAQMRLLVMN